MQPFPGVIISLQAQGVKYKFSGFTQTNKQTNKITRAFLVRTPLSANNSTSKSGAMSRSFRPFGDFKFVGLFSGRGLNYSKFKGLAKNITQIQHQSPPSPNLRITAPSNNPNKDRLCQYFPRGLTSQKTLRKPLKQNALVPHNLSLFTTSRRMRAMIFRVP